MLSVSTETKNLFLENEHVRKNIYITITKPDFGLHENGSSVEYEFGNQDIVSESLEIEQNLCDGEADFVGCVASKCTFSLYEHLSTEELQPWKSFWVDGAANYKVQIEIEGVNPSGISERFVMWTGYVTDAEANFLNGEIKYTCYDIFGTEEFKDWDFGDSLYWKLEDGDLPITSVLTYMKSLFNDLDFVNINDLSNDFNVVKQDCFKGMKALDLLKYICQMNGLFGVVRYDGKIEFRSINGGLGESLITFPSDDTFPGEETYPGLIDNDPSNYILLPYSTFESSDRMQFEEPPIDGVIIKEIESGDAKYQEKDKWKDVKNYESANHVIKILGNPFIHEKTPEQKRNVCRTVQNNAGGYVYHNYTADTKGMPFIEVGDYVDFIVRNWLPTELDHTHRYRCLVLHRTLKGIQHMVDTYSADTVDKYDWLKEKPLYLCALSGASSVEEDMDNQINEEEKQELEDKIDEKVDEEQVDDIVDEKIDEKLDGLESVWNVKSVDSAPGSPEPHTIYFIRGIIEMHAYQENNE